ncbi:retrovirus-related pol polyprotein from transposon TNT 1-94 [Tanacetum coccineum]
MEQNLPVITKKLWSLMRVMFFMLKKGISKAKIMADLSMMIKRGKIARKSTSSSYEFICNNTPPYPVSIFSSHKKNRSKHQHLTNYNPPLAVNDCDDIVINSAVLMALDMVTNTSPMMITNSPIPVTNVGEDCHVDEAADKFIRRFYNDLRREN